MRLVTLLPSATETVCALGLDSQLVGISHECDYPESITRLPRLTSSSINPKERSKNIHESVESLIKNTLSVYNLDLDLLRKLQPDLIITQDICDVCAIPLDQVKEGCQEVLGTDVAILSLKPYRLNDVWKDIFNVANALDQRETYDTFKQKVDQRIQHLQNKIQSANRNKKGILTIEWMDPVMIGGMWVPEMIELIGGEALLASPGQHAQTVDKARLKEINPDVVVIKPCGFKLDQTMQELDVLKETVPWESWDISKTNHVFLVDGNAYFNRPGPRIIDSLEILAFCTHPDLFPELGETYRNSFIRLAPGLTLAE